MCGLTGFLDSRRACHPEEMAALVGAMADRPVHRGPDDRGTWIDADAGFAVGHRRLSIIDLSAEGHQPMVSAAGRWILAYNGEVYNHRDLRRRLEDGGSGFRGHSDTEVLLAAIEAWGLAPTLTEVNGMFALAA
jgi:asparagine synthase (glutamine-hydrolysing)